MKTKVTLELYSDYYRYDDGTSTHLAAVMEWKRELDLPQPMPRSYLQLGDVKYQVKTSILDEDGSQTIIVTDNFGYNRNREGQLPKYEKRGWCLAKEYNA